MAANRVGELVRLSVDRDSGVWTLCMCAGDNRFNPQFIEAMNRALDQVERSDGPCALVLSSQSEKFFSNGHDVQWLERAVLEAGGDTSPTSPAGRFIESFYDLLARFMTFPVVTVAAVSGHAFAGGLLLALAQDYRVMRGDRGFCCMNEIDMALLAPEDAVVKPGAFAGADQKLASVLLAKLPALQVRRILLEGERLDGRAAQALGLVDSVCDGAESVVHNAIKLAATHSPRGEPRNRRTVQVLKYELVRHVLATLKSPPGQSRL